MSEFLPPAIQKLQAIKKSTQASSVRLFPAGLAAHAEFDDVDQLTSTISNWEHNVVQLGCGRFHGSLTLAHTNSLQLYRAAWSPAFLVQGRVPQGSVVFGVQCGGAPGAVWRGKELTGNDVLLLDSDQEVDLQTRDACDVLVLSVSTDLFAEHADALRGEQTNMFTFDRWNVLDQPLALQELVQHWKALLQTALNLGTGLCQHQIVRQIEAETLEMLLVRTAPPVREASLTERRRVALRARQYILMHSEESLTIKDICQAVRSSERTLHLGFREVFGITPKRFLKSLRLYAVRCELQKAEPHQTVTSLACRWGFLHFSNFAADYYRQFGEMPSTTLLRKRKR